MTRKATYTATEAKRRVREMRKPRLLTLDQAAEYLGVATMKNAHERRQKVKDMLPEEAIYIIPKAIRGAERVRAVVLEEVLGEKI